MYHSEIIIIGGGAAGLMAASELSANKKRVVLLEARDRIGGRIHTIHNATTNIFIEAGAEFIHGKLPLTCELLKRANSKFHKTKGKFFRFANRNWETENNFNEGWDELMKQMQNIKTDITITEFLQQYFSDDKYSNLRKSVQGFAEGFDLADINKASTIALRDEWMHEENGQYRIEGGYEQLINRIKNDCTINGTKIFPSSVVKKIEWEKNEVKIFTSNNEKFTAEKVIITVPLGVLQLPSNHENAIQFSPEIERQKKAANEIGYGSVIKIILQFKEAFWNEYKKNIGFVLSDQKIPTWWTQLPDESAVLTGWLGGPAALQFQHIEDETLLQIALQSLSNIFGLSIKMLQKLLVEKHVFNWMNDSFSFGAYSYAKLNTNNAIKILNEPINGTLFFAGEAMYNGESPGTVEAALVSGKNIAKKLLS